LKVAISKVNFCKTNYSIYALLLCIGFAAICKDASAQKTTKPLPPLSFSQGKLNYSFDSLGNRVPDFSYCGFMASESAIPDIPVKIVVPIVPGDATIHIQAALDYVAGLMPDANGYRGTVLLKKGKYEVSGQLRINASGVVLRGSGMNENGTVLIGAGTGRLALIKIIGKNDKVIDSIGLKITDSYVPVNATKFHVEGRIRFDKKFGNKIIIHRPSNREWIAALGMDIFGGGISSLGWKAGDRDIFFDRTIVKTEGNEILIDAPLTTALDASFGGAVMYYYHWPGRINFTGVENLRCISAYDTSNQKDEAHRWNAINIENAEDAWVRQVSFENFAGSAVNVLETAKRITVEDCKSLHPVSEIGGQRRYTFFTTGQQTLFQRCYAEDGYHDFATGYCAPGPNAFVQCESVLPHSFSGAIDSWASGVLFDVVNVDGNALRFGNRGQDANGAGWSAANSVFWNCSAARIDCYKPPTAQNWAFGSWSQFSGDGYWGESNNTIQPRSLYYAQLGERLNKNVDHLSHILNIPTEASSSPSVETANELTKQSAKPRMQLKEWIDQSAQRNLISTEHNNVKAINDTDIKKIVSISKAPAAEIKNGWLVRGDKILTGSRQGVPWWSGGVQGKDLKNARPAITRFVPGRTGKGLTDDLDELTDGMKANRIIGIEHNYGLWYDRRRDDHERIRRMDGEVWPPFYELPFARSGKETAWDGLSKYDLSKYNQFYWSRLKQFADLADQKSLLLIHQNYFQHNIIEAGAHYADFPWRTANNINNTGFPEPVPYAGDKRIFMAELFYDTSHSVRRELHIKYIRQCLENFRDNNGVIQLIGEEYTGPLHFVQFWLNTVRDWQKEKGKRQLIGLSTTKDVQDAILNDPAYASVVDIIDIRYWHYQADEKVYAPAGGQNLAPRQHARLLKPKSTSSQQVYRAVLEYKLRFPDKAVIYSADNWDKYGWAVLMAGGSIPNVLVNDENFLKAVSGMCPYSKDVEAAQWVLFNNNTGYIILDMSNKVSFDLSKTKGDYEVIWVNMNKGEVQRSKQVIKSGKIISVNKPDNGSWVLWLKRK